MKIRVRSPRRRLAFAGSSVLALTLVLLVALGSLTIPTVAAEAFASVDTVEQPSQAELADVSEPPNAASAPNADTESDTPETGLVPSDKAPVTTEELVVADQSAPTTSLDSPLLETGLPKPLTVSDFLTRASGSPTTRIEGAFIMRAALNQAPHFPVHINGPECVESLGVYNVCRNIGYYVLADAVAASDSVWTFPGADGTGLVSRKKDGACLAHSAYVEARPHQTNDPTRLLPGSHPDCKPGKALAEYQHTAWRHDGAAATLQAVHDGQPAGLWFGFQNEYNPEVIPSKAGRLTAGGNTGTPMGNGWVLSTSHMTTLPPVTPPAPVVDHRASTLTVTRDAFKFTKTTDTQTASVVVKDTAGNTMDGVSVTFQVLNPSGSGVSSSATPQYVTRTTANGGKASTTITSSSDAGDFPVVAAISGTDISGSRTQKAPFVAAVATLTITPESRPADNSTAHTAEVTLKTDTGVLVPGRKVSFGLFANNSTTVAAATGDARLVGATTLTTGVSGAGTGKASIQITAGTAGSYPVSATLDDLPKYAVAGSKTVRAVFHKATLAVSATHTVDKTQVAPGGTFTYTLTATNTGNMAAGNPMLTFAVPKGLKVLSRTPTDGFMLNSTTNVATWYPGNLTGGASAQATITVQADTPGSYVSQIVGLADTNPAKTWCTVADRAACAPDRTVVVTDPNAVGSSELTVTPGVKLADGKETHVVTATVRNAQGQGATGQTIRFSVVDLDGKAVDFVTLEPTTGVTPSTGTVETRVKTTVPGDYRVVATYGAGLPVGVGSVPVEFTLVSGTYSTLTVSEGIVDADGTTPHFATVKLRDTKNRPILNQPVELSVTTAQGAPATMVTIGGGSTHVSSSSADFEIPLTTNVAGKYPVTASVDFGKPVTPVGNQIAEFGPKKVYTGVSITHEPSVTEVEVGETFTYTLTVTNDTDTTTDYIEARFLIANFLTKGVIAYEKVVSGAGYMKSGSWWIDNPDLKPGESRTVVLQVKAVKAGSVTSKVTHLGEVTLGTRWCTTGAEPGCGSPKTVRVIEKPVLDIVCPVTPSESGILAFSGQGVPSTAAKVLLYVKTGDAQTPKFWAEATITGSGANRSWSFTNTTPLAQGKYSFTVRWVDAQGKESEDSAVSCDVGVVSPLQVTGTKVVENFPGQSQWVSTGDPADWLITATAGPTTQPISGGLQGTLVPGKPYTIGEQLRVSPAPNLSARLYAQKGTPRCVDGAGTALPAAIFDAQTGTITLDATGGTIVPGPLACSITNQTANVSFVTRGAGGQTKAPSVDWSLQLAHTDPAFGLTLDDVTFVSKALPATYKVAASVPAGAGVVGYDRLKSGVAGCQAAAANDPASAPTICWEPAGSGTVLAAAAIPQGHHTVFRVNWVAGGDLPALPLTGGLGSWQFLVSGAAVLLIASVAYAVRTRRLAGPRIRRGSPSL